MSVCRQAGIVYGPSSNPERKTLCMADMVTCKCISQAAEIKLGYFTAHQSILNLLSKKSYQNIFSLAVACLKRVYIALLIHFYGA